eukprot:TRINITY_DN3739_c0_g1_i4.p1 TRINITY_DN3739_c0_g1~~TRINITY_DN3739_c0_g1_i4.p1  ORF type:complete len:214 (+),score=39.59 TRINITY_DN3739_c0_g1_i4:116-757(+)
MLELINAKRVYFSYEQYRDMERRINSATHCIQISMLQRISKAHTNKLKEGEEEKRKSYKAVVWLSKKVTDKDLAFLKDLKDLEIEQRTPVRVLHRRSLATRKKIIHSMSYEIINENHIVLDLRTQAGTYIKEFVHGDLGRTLPNFGVMMGCEADILQLDVMSVEVDFPGVPQANRHQQFFDDTSANAPKNSNKKKKKKKKKEKRGKKRDEKKK